MARPDYLVMRDLIDEQIVTADGRAIGRVADIEASWREDGQLVLTGLCVGPQSLARRVSGRLGPLARFIFRGKFDYVIPIDEIKQVSLDLQLRQDAAHYRVGHADRWVVDHILRFIPGNGRHA